MPVSPAKKLLAELQKTFGEDKAMMASEIPVGPPVSTGSLALDYATGYGGLPSNRVVEICGKEGTGKTTLALMAMLNALEMYPESCAIFLDVEHKLTKDWLETIVGAGLLDNRIVYLQPTSIEEATNMYRQSVSSGGVCCAILDSIGGAPTVRRNDDATVGHYGGNAQGVGEFARSAATHASIYNCLTIGINQTRVDMSGYNQLITPGGRAFGHACVLRVELVRGRETEHLTLAGEKVPVGHNVFAKIRKNQVGAPGRTAMYWFYHIPTPERGFGVDTLDEIARLGVKTGVLTMRGGWYHHPEFAEGRVQGLPKVKELLRADTALRSLLSSQVIASLDSVADQVAPISDPDAPVEVDVASDE